MKAIKTLGKVFLAPMAGVNDLAFRKMCMDYGCGLNFTEMISVNAVERSNKAVLRLARTLPSENVAIQLFGTRISAIKKAIKVLSDNSPDIVPKVFDFNFGCPADKIMRQGAGSSLLKRPTKIGEIISAMRGATDLPISAKIRLGITPKSANYLKTSKIVEDNGADILTVHARYQSEGYSGVAHWDKIREIKQHINIPVVGNGDVVDEDSLARLFHETGCDYAMVGRGAMGNPFIFKRLSESILGRRIGQKNKATLFLEYYELAKKYDLDEKQIKQQAMYFSKGMASSAMLRKSISSSNTNQIYETFKKYLRK